MLLFPPLSGHFAASGFQVRYRSVCICLLLVWITSRGWDIDAPITCIMQDILWPSINSYDVIWGERGKTCLFISMEDRCLLRHGIWWFYYLVSKACLESEGPKATACQKDFKFHICLLTSDPSLPAAVGTVCHLCWHTQVMPGAGKRLAEPSL